MTGIHIKDGIATVDNDNSLAAALIAGCKGKVIIKSPLLKGGRQEFKNIKKVK